MTDTPPIIRIHPSDHVAVALADLPAGTTVRMDATELLLPEAIPRGHKLALAAIARGQNVFKYGFPIGQATAEIAPGQHVHTHNLTSRLQGIESYAYRPASTSSVPHPGAATLEGYERPDGTVGIRNEIWIIPTVGCVNRVCDNLARQARAAFHQAGIDGIFAFPHPHGCSQLGDDLARTQRLLAGLARHPNAAGVLVVGLGCENNNLSAFREVLGAAESARVRFLAAQEVQDELRAGLNLLEQLATSATGCRRQPIPIAKLVVGLKCGGSDAFSGITANPLLGAVSDRLVSMGASTLLTEVPEMFGAETILLERCARRDVFDNCVAMIDGFKAYYQRHNHRLDENPSPGNLQGGITTLEEKSLGCVQKGGTSPVVDVLDYARPVARPGLSLVSAPGNDLVSTTALAAAGAQIILFTTGRGTPLGGPVPTLKISTTSQLAARKKTWVDFDAGTLLAGESMAAVADRLLDLLLAVAAGRQTRNEENDCREIAIFKDGVTL